jgi:hypothetical protein
MHLTNKRQLRIKFTVKATGEIVADTLLHPEGPLTNLKNCWNVGIMEALESAK